MAARSKGNTREPGCVAFTWPSKNEACSRPEKEVTRKDESVRIGEASRVDWIWLKSYSGRSSQKITGIPFPGLHTNPKTRYTKEEILAVYK